MPLVTSKLIFIFEYLRFSFKRQGDTVIARRKPASFDGDETAVEIGIYILLIAWMWGQLYERHMYCITLLCHATIPPNVQCTLIIRFVYLNTCYFLDKWT